MQDIMTRLDNIQALDDTLNRQGGTEFCVGKGSVWSACVGTDISLPHCLPGAGI